MKTKSSKVTRIYLMRPGQAAQAGAMSGRTDYPLDNKGRTELKAWAEFFAPIPLTAVWCSPLKRAAESAEIVMKHLNRPVIARNFFLENGFTEIALGKWEGLTEEEAQLKYPAEWQARCDDSSAPPEGESYAELSSRVNSTMQRLYGSFIEHQHVLIMAHKAVNQAILAGLGEPYANSWLEIPQDFATLNELELTKKRNGLFNCKIIRANARPPLWLRQKKI